MSTQFTEMKCREDLRKENHQYEEGKRPGSKQETELRGSDSINSVEPYRKTGNVEEETDVIMERMTSFDPNYENAKRQLQKRPHLVLNMCTCFRTPQKQVTKILMRIALFT